MRKLLAIGILTWVGFTFTHCGLNKTVAQSTIENVAPIISGEAVYPLIGLNNTDTSILSISYQYFTTKPSFEEYKDSVNMRIHDFVQTTTEFEMQDEQGILNHSFFTSQLDSFAQTYYGQEDENSNVWSLEATINIDDSFPDFVALTFSAWSYTGGAHGNGFVSIHMIDKSNGQLLALPDFIIDIEELNAIVEPIFRQANELKPNESLNDAGYWFTDDKFSVNDNFYFSDEMMVFYYNTYEIAPYSGGPTELQVPIAMIKHLLKRKI